MNMNNSQLLRKHSMLHGLRPEFTEALRDGANAIEQTDKLQKSFALACRILDDEMCCPYYVFDGIDWPECDGETGSCGDRGKWECWQKYFKERVDAEQVCRVCGCTQNNACPGGCSWVEPDLCSDCAEPGEPVEVFMGHCQCGMAVDDDDEICPNCERPIVRT